MTMIGEPDFGVDPKEVAAHEYGHHIAHNRVNPPWLAEDWGTKRWSSYAGICTRTAQGTAFPGDEDTNYRLNPGEAFAEVYRTLVDSRRGAAFDWSIVDSSFIPNTTALKAVEDDVLHRWTTPTSRFVQGRFRVGGPKLWKLVLSTPLDGALDVALTVPRGGLYNLTVLGPDGRTVLATGLWSGTSQKRLTYTICGQRLLELRVARVGVAGRFSVRYAQP